MLHVFDVCAGQMQALDMGLLTHHVHALQVDLAAKTRVAVKDQVLLVSGGEVLESDKRVSDYGAGTDSNPIFLVSKGDTPAITDGPENLKYEWSSLRDQVQQLKDNPVSYEIVKRLATLAKQASPLANDALCLCTRLVHEQHLLHQGWNALVVHLDDTAQQFCRRARRFKDNREHFIQRIDTANDLLKGFAEDLTLLDTIPVCETLLSADEYNKLRSGKGDGQKPTLLDWICASDPDSSIHELATVAQNLLEDLQDEQSLAPIVTAESVQSAVDNEAMKEIKGIGNRLRQLDDGLRKAEDAFAMANDKTQSAMDCEQNALKESRDVSNLEKIRETQLSYCNEIFAALETLLTIASKFADSKIELLENVRHRIANWIKTTHHDIFQGSTQLYVHGEKLSSLKKRLELIRQMHEASTIYANSVTEVLRRQRFSKEFNAWASAIVEQMQKLGKDEMEARKRVKEKLQKHFLRTLFVGMSDGVPDFANKLPDSFDDKMPALTAESLRELRDTVPTIAPLLQVSQPRIFEKLAVHDPSWSSTLRREASFFTHTPPKMALTARSIPSFAWMSGDENLERSTSPSPSSRMGFVALGLASNEASPDMNQQQESCETVCDPVSARRGSSASTINRSAPIRIPSKPPSDGMSTSRQLSEKSSRFGTPEQDLPGGDPASLEDMATSPPEFVSGSALKYEIGQMTNDIVEKVESWNSTSGTTSTNTASTNTNAESSTKPIDDKDRKNLSEVIGQLGLLKAEVGEMRQVVLQTVSVSAAAEIPVEMKEKMQSLLQNVEKLIVAKETEPLSAEISELKEKFDAERIENAGKLEVKHEKCEDLEKQIRLMEEWLRVKEENLDQIKEERESSDRVWAGKVNEAQAEVIKQLTISHELEMDDLRNEHRQILQNRENEIDELKSRVVEKESTIRLMHSEQDKLVAVVCENRGSIGESPVGSPISPVSSLMLASSLESSVNVQKQTRCEVQKEYKSKLNLLTQGLVDDKKRMKERFMKEKEYELRMAQEAADAEMNKMRAHFGAQVAQLTAKLSASTAATAPQRRDSATEMRNISPPAIIMTRSVPSPDNVPECSTSVMSSSTMPMTESVMSIPQAVQEDTQMDCSSGLTVKQTQTRLKLKDMANFCNICDVKEGDIVLVVWDEDHRAYAVYTPLQQMYYFVKSKKNSTTSLQLAASGDDQSAIATACAIVKVVKLEFCQITKPDNRYRLPLGTKFSRVEVDRITEKSALKNIPKLLSPIALTPIPMNRESTEQGPPS